MLYLVTPQRSQLQDGRAAPRCNGVKRRGGGIFRKPLAAQRDNDEAAQLLQTGKQKLQQLDARAIGPLRVFDGEHRRAARALRANHVDDRAEVRPLFFTRARSGLAQPQRAQARARIQAVDDLGKGQVRRAHVLRAISAGHDRRRLQILFEFAQQAGLSDPRLTLDEHQSNARFAGRAELFVEKIQLFSPAYEVVAVQRAGNHRLPPCSATFPTGHALVLARGVAPCYHSKVAVGPAPRPF